MASPIQQVDLRADPRSGYAPVNGLDMYYEIHGSGRPLVLLHGGLGATTMFDGLRPALADSLQVVAVDLQGHGRTADIERPLSFEASADDVAALIRHLDLQDTAVLGYSFGGGVALQLAFRHPELVRRLVVVSAPYARDGWHPEVRAGMERLSGAAAETLRPSPMYRHYAAVAPDPEGFPRLLDKTGALGRRDYDWSREVAALEMPTLLVFGDADSVPPAHAAAFFALLGGGRADAGWDGAAMSRSRLAILPATTHYDILSSPLLAATVAPFLAAPPPSAPAPTAARPAETAGGELLRELGREAATTRRVLERVPPERLGWRPHDRSLTLGQLAMHVATLPGAIAGIAARPTFDVDAGVPYPDAEGVEELLDALERSLERARTLIGRMDDAALAEPWRMTSGGREVAASPRYEVLRSVLLNHWIHHRGQLTVYLRQTGTPVPAIYGASADEDPFAA